MASTQDPGELHEGRDGRRELYTLVNWLRRRVGSTLTDADVWTSSDQTAILPASVNLGALSSGILYHTVTASVSTPAVVTVDDSLDFTAPTLSRAALTGDVTASLGSNTTAFRSFSARSVLANATAAGAVPTELSSGTDGFVLRQSGTTLSFGTIGAVSIPALDATFITQTPNANLANEQALSALTSGVLSSVTATGVVSSTAFTANRIAFGSGANGTLTDSSLLNWDGTTLGVGTASPTASATATWEDSVNGTAGHFVHNGNGGTATQALVLLQTAASAAFGSTPYAILSATGTAFTPVGAIPASSAYLEHNGGSLAIGAVSGDVIFYSGAGRTEKAKVANGGNVSIANLTAGGVVYATAATGVLKIGTSAEVASAITWPATERILYSSGTTTAPSGSAGFEFDVSENQFWISGFSQGWYNSGQPGAADYEHVRAYWSGNTFRLESLASGTGTIRDMTIDANTATLTLEAATTNVTGTITTVYGSTQTEVGQSGTTPIITILDPGAGFAYKIRFDPSTTVATDASLQWDGVHHSSATLTITGAGNVTTATGVNAATFSVPTIDGNGTAKTITNAANVMISGPPVGANSATITNAYPLWIQSGVVRIDGAIALGGGAAATLGTIGGSGPTAAAQNKWIALNVDGTAYFLPLWV